MDGEYSFRQGGRGHAYVAGFAMYCGGNEWPDGFMTALLCAFEAGGAFDAGRLLYS